MQYTTLVPARAWQKKLHYGRFRRNSEVMKPIVWIFQQMKVRAAQEGQRR